MAEQHKLWCGKRRNHTETEDTLGGLELLIGKWVGNLGVNFIAIPAVTSVGSQTPHFKKITQNYIETIEFTPIGREVANHGGANQNDPNLNQKVFGLQYEIVIANSDTLEPLHTENGTFLHLVGDGKQSSIVRQAAVPHGNSLLFTGNIYKLRGGPNIDFVANATPVGTPPNMLRGYREGFPLDVNKHLTDFNKQMEADGFSFTETTVIDLSTHNPTLGGGIMNVLFAKKFAEPIRTDAVFWIEKVVGPSGDFLQLQYTQNTSLAFFQNVDPVAPGQDTRVIWPHIQINTLRKQ